MGFGGRSSTEKANDAALQGFSTKLSDISDVGGQRGKKAWKFFKKSAKPAMNYYNTLLTGDKGAITELLSPEISNISNQYGNAARNIGEFGPRGGGSNSAINKLQTGQAQQMSNLFSSARPMGAQGLGNLSGMFGNMSLGQTGQQIDALSGASKNLFGLNAQEEAARQRKAQAWGSIGSGLGSVAGGIFGGK